MKKVKRPLFLSILAISYVVLFVLSLVIVANQLNSPYPLKRSTLDLALGCLLAAPILFYCVWNPGKWKYRIVVGFYVLNSVLCVAEKDAIATFISVGVLTYFLTSQKAKEWYFQ